MTNTVLKDDFNINNGLVVHKTGGCFESMCIYSLLLLYFMTWKVEARISILWSTAETLSAAIQHLRPTWIQ